MEKYFCNVVVVGKLGLYIPLALLHTNIAELTQGSSSNSPSPAFIQKQFVSSFGFIEINLRKVDVLPSSQ